jgi:class 3 adenylate cyclase
MTVTSANGEGALPEPSSELRASDDDRQRTIALLRRAAGEGCIDLDELEHRIESTYDARTRGDLEAVTSDLPDTFSPPPPSRRTDSPPAHRNPLVLEDDEFRGHLTVYCLVIGMLIGIWLLGGAGHFWPFYPAAGWGIGLGSHYQRAARHQRKRLARATAEGITLDELEQREEAERKQRRSDMVQRVLPSRAGTPPRLPPDPLGLLLPDSTRGARAVPDEPASRFVVAMFVDVVGSTSLNEALGDQQWVRVRTAFRTQVRECAGAHGGWEANTSGDGVLLRLDHPASAARAATDIMRRLDRQRTETGFAPSIRIGIHSGDAVEEGDDILGNVVNLAARVCDAADIDEVLVTEHVADHLDGRHTTAGRGLHTLKGIARPRHLLALVWR